MLYTDKHLSSHKNMKINIMINYIKNIYHTFRTRDANSAVNIMKLTTCWINNQTRPEEFSRASSFTCLGEETRKSKTIVVKAE